jgi:hypothetical protein
VYASILRDRVADPTRQAEVAGRLNTGLAPLLRYAPGCIVCYVLAVDGGEVASIGIFADRAAAEGAARLATDWIESRMGELIAGAPEISIGIVTVH